MLAEPLQTIVLQLLRDSVHPNISLSLSRSWFCSLSLLPHVCAAQCQMVSKTWL